MSEKAPMKTRIIGIAATVLGFGLTGCSSSVDLSREPEVQRAGMIGRTLELTSDVDLVRLFYDTPTILELKPRSEGRSAVGSVHRGTRLRVLRIERLDADYRKGPGLYVRERVTLTFARIEDGPHAGKTVATEGIGVSADRVARSEFVR
jgi:hypothetical protein